MFDDLLLAIRLTIYLFQFITRSVYSLESNRIKTLKGVIERRNNGFVCSNCDNLFN